MLTMTKMETMTGKIDKDIEDGKHNSNKNKKRRHTKGNQKIK